MPPKFKSNDGILSMYLVPKKMFNTLLSILNEDDENKNELIAINQNQTSNNNYIENAIAFKKQQKEQKKNTLTSNLQKFDITDNQSVVTPNTLSRTVSTFRTPQPYVQQSDTSLVNDSSDITLPQSQTTDEQEKRSNKKSVTLSTSTPVKRPYNYYTYRNSPILEAIKKRNASGKYVCPFEQCKKQYVAKKILAAHLLDKHYTELAMRERRLLSTTSQSPKKTPSPLKQKTSSPSKPEKTLLASATSTDFFGDGSAKKNIFSGKYSRL